MTLLNLSDGFEGSISETLFLKFSKVFEASSLYKLNKKIRAFETARPRLSFAGFADFTRIVPVTGKYLFSYGAQRYLDLERKIDQSLIDERVNKLGVAYFETSAKLNENVDVAFESLSIQILNNLK